MEIERKRRRVRGSEGWEERKRRRVRVTEGWERAEEKKNKRFRGMGKSRRGGE